MFKNVAIEYKQQVEGPIPSRRGSNVSHGRTCAPKLPKGSSTRHKMGMTHTDDRVGKERAHVDDVWIEVSGVVASLKKDADNVIGTTGRPTSGPLGSRHEKKNSWFASR